MRTYEELLDELEKQIQINVKLARQVLELTQKRRELEQRVFEMGEIVEEIINIYEGKD